MLSIYVHCSAQLNVRNNRLGDEGEAAIRKAVSGKAGFELEINKY